MKTYHKTLLAGSMAAIASAGTANATLVIIDDGGIEVRLTNGASALENGGGDDYTLIGTNGTVDNWGLYDLDLSSLSGLTLTGDATLTFAKDEFAVGANNVGNSSDTLSVHELFLTNAGWIEGTSIIGGGAVSDGSPTFSYFAQTNSSGAGTPWQDALGNNVANLTGAFGAAIDTQPGYDPSAATGTLVTFTIPQAVAQGWIDNGLAGVIISAADVNGDNKGRFRVEDATLTVNVVPEPGSLALLGLGGLLIGARRRRD